jgi:hypothetical protein
MVINTGEPILVGLTGRRPDFICSVIALDVEGKIILVE